MIILQAIFSRQSKLQSYTNTQNMLNNLWLALPQPWCLKRGLERMGISHKLEQAGELSDSLKRDNTYSCFLSFLRGFLVNTGLKGSLRSYDVFWHWLQHLVYAVQASWMFVKSKIGTRLASLQAWACISLLSSDHGTFWVSEFPLSRKIHKHT